MHLRPRRPRRRRLGLALLVLGSCLAGSTPASAQPIHWTVKGPMPTPRVYMGAVALQGSIWVLGGYSGTTLARVDTYDPVTDTWAAKKPMPTPRAQLVAAVVNGKIYAIGGFQFQGLAPAVFTPVTEEYDPATDTWTPRASIPFPPPAPGFRNSSIGGVAVGDKIYVTVFHAGISYTYEYDPAADAWNTAKAPVPFTYTGYAAAALGGKLYVAANGEAPWGGPFTGGLPLAEYSPASDVWILRSPTPSVRRAVGFAAVAGRLYAVGGAEVEDLEPEETFFRALATVESFDPATNQWSAATPMLTPRIAPTVVLFAGKVYVLGGGVRASNSPLTPLVPLDDVEEGDPTPAPGSCIANATTLCIDDLLGDGRFEATVSYSTVQGGGRTGFAGAIPLAPLGVARGGVFWFFAADNPEMLLKVLDACALNQRFWVFASAGTNVGFTLRVRDTQTGAVFTHTNPDLNPAPPIQATSALPCN